MSFNVKAALGAVLLSFGGGVIAAGTVATAPRGSMPLFDAAAINKRCPAELADARARLQKMESGSGPTVLAEWNRWSIGVADFIYPVYLLANVSTDEATRTAALACVEAFTPLDVEPYQSEKLFARVRGLRPADAIDRQYRQDLLDAFEDAGIALAPPKRKRVREIREEIDKLSLRFQSNVNEDKSTVVLTQEQVQGLPQAWLDARKRDAEGRLIVTLDAPTYGAFLDNATNADARRQMYVARMRVGGEANLPILERVLALRYEMAQIYGYPDFAAFALRRSMAKTPAAVNDFLARVRRAVDEGELKDLEVLRQDKAALLGKAPTDVNLDRWDASFHAERVRRARFDIDQEALRAYFPADPSVAFAMRVAERLYGVVFVARDVPRWSNDVRYYDLFEKKADGSRGKFIGGIYLDLFPREGKYNHAAAFTVRNVSTLAARTPVSALVANLNPGGLTHDELETLLHEFGHVLHGVLSKARYNDQGGTNVKRDFVEAPSQMFEEWTRRPESLALFADVCGACPKLSAQQIERLNQARLFGVGMRYARQWQYASFDMRIHTGAPPSPMQVWKDIETNSALGYVDGSMFPVTFGHVVGGYAAGYYGYMWSEVLALDMLEGFHGKLLDANVGKRYRTTILEPGAQRPPLELVESFLGRKPSPDAFFAEITGKRN